LALFWAYVLKIGKDYTEESAKNSISSPCAIKTFFYGVAVDPKLITEPLTEEQLQAANAWKYAYLQRLRREKTDESYIQTYLKAWNLSEEQVFAAGQK
jgi:hypothetical protein